jgi:LacI family repressor for deo operon, udp, cdd, tsx, nupC, and nupG
MAPKPTISDVAARAGVSKGAVSFALNGKPGVSNGTRSRILEAAGDLGFSPSHTARSLASSRTGALAMVLARQPDLLRSDPFFPPFVAGVESVIAPAGQALLLRFVPDARAERAAYTELAHGRADGVLISDLRTRDPRPALLAELGLPAVTLNRPTGRSPFPAVCLDDTRGVRDAVDHLVRLGHSRIAHVAGPARYLHAASRRREWTSVLSDAGLQPGQLVETDFTAAGGAAATRTLLDRPDRPTAILYANDLMAVAGMAVAHRRGLRIPADLSVIGFDDAELSAHLHPPLATVRTDAYDWGRAAATALLELLAGNEAPDVHLSPAEFIARESTARPPRAARTAVTRTRKPTQEPALRTRAAGTTDAPEKEFHR